MREYLRRLLAMLGPEERLVVESIAAEQDEETVIECGARLLAGEKAYGKLDLRNDSRDWNDEIREELLDIINYRHMARVQAKLRGESVDPPVSLSERVAQLELKLAEFEDAEVVLEPDWETEKPDESN